MSLRNKGSMTHSVTVSREPDRSGTFVCNGTNDEVEIQAAIDYIYGQFSGGTVKIKEGSYSIGASITQESGVTVEGNGLGAPGDPVGNRPGVGGTYLSLDANVHMFASRDNQYNWFMGLKDLYIDLQGKAFNAVRWLGSRSGKVEHCAFLDGIGDIIYEDDSAAADLGQSNWYINNFFMMDNGVVAGAGARAIRGERDGFIHNNRFDFISSGRFYRCVWVDGGGWRITQNHFNHANDAMIYTNASGQTICENYFDINYNEGIFSADGADGHVITDNRFQEMSTGVGVPAIQINNCNDAMITGNRFFGGTPTYNITMLNTCQRNVIKDNSHLTWATAPVYDLNPELNYYDKVIFQFTHTIDATIQTTSPYGVLVDSGDPQESAIGWGCIPLGVQQVMYVAVRGVALDASGAGQMRGAITHRAGAMNEQYDDANKSWTVANWDSEETGLIIDDGVSWIVKAGDVGGEIWLLRGGDTLEFALTHQDGAGDDIETNAVIRTYELYVV